MRGSDHVKEIRRYEIKSGGLVVGKAFVGREGLLTGTPRRTRYRVAPRDCRTKNAPIWGRLL
jgi:hypothetical protein